MFQLSCGLGRGGKPAAPANSRPVEQEIKYGQQVGSGIEDLKMIYKLKPSMPDPAVFLLPLAASVLLKRQRPGLTFREWGEELKSKNLTDVC